MGQGPAHLGDVPAQHGNLLWTQRWDVHCRGQAVALGHLRQHVHHLHPGRDWARASQRGTFARAAPARSRSCARTCTCCEGTAHSDTPALQPSRKLLGPRTSSSDTAERLGWCSSRLMASSGCPRSMSRRSCPPARPQSLVTQATSAASLSAGRSSCWPSWVTYASVPGQHVRDPHVCGVLHATLHLSTRKHCPRSCL